MMTTVREKAVALFSDASFCPETHVGAGAYWAQSGDIILSSTMELVGATQPHEAEILAACRGIEAVVGNPTLVGRLQNGTRAQLLLFADCAAVAHAFSAKCKTRLSKAALRIVREVRELIAKLHLKLKVVHVRAHCGADTPQKRRNCWCDEQSRKRMRLARERLGLKEMLAKKKEDREARNRALEAARIQDAQRRRHLSEKLAREHASQDDPITITLKWTPPADTGRIRFSFASA